MKRSQSSRTWRPTSSPLISLKVSNKLMILQGVISPRWSQLTVVGNCVCFLATSAHPFHHVSLSPPHCRVAPDSSQLRSQEDRHKIARALEKENSNDTSHVHQHRVKRLTANSACNCKTSATNWAMGDWLRPMRYHTRLLTHPRTVVRRWSPADGRRWRSPGHHSECTT